MVRFALLEIDGVRRSPSSRRAGRAARSIEQPCVEAPLGLRPRRRCRVRVATDGRQTIPSGSAFHVPPAAPPIDSWSRAPPASPASNRSTRSSTRATRRSRPAGSRSSGSRSAQRRDDHPGGRHGPLPEPSRSMPGLADVVAGHDPGAVRPGSGYTDRLVRRAALGPRDVGSPRDRVGGRHRDPLRRRHLPLSGGPPGHRLEAADPAEIIDLTPIAALRRRDPGRALAAMAGETGAAADPGGIDRGGRSRLTESAQSRGSAPTALAGTARRRPSLRQPRRWLDAGRILDDGRLPSLET